MKKTVLFLNTFLIAILFATIGVKAAMAAPHLLMSPASGNYVVGDTFNITVKVDSATDVVGGVDGVGTYDSTKLELVSATKASPMVFDSADSSGGCAITNSEAGKFSFSCYSNDSLGDKVAVGNLVVLNFRAKAIGTAVAAFTCTAGSTTDSNIVKTSTVTDVIACGENVGGSYTITAGTGGSTTTITPTPTTSTSTTSASTPTATSTATTTLPQTGAIGSTIGLVVFGAISLLSALFLKFL